MRGDSLEDFSVVEFFTNTYESKITSGSEVNDEEGANVDHHAQVGRPRHNHVFYQNLHPKSKTLLRIIRPLDHNNLPNFIGHQLPRNDDPDTYEFYCAMMLMLLKPWRNLFCDLKRQEETWNDAFQDFVGTTSPETLAILSGIQYLHQCQTAADNDSKMLISSEINHENMNDDNDLIITDSDDLSLNKDSQEFNEDTLKAIIQSQTSL